MSKSRSARSAITVRIRNWDLWSLPTRAVIYLLTIEMMAAATIIIDVLTGLEITPQDWSTFAMLFAVTHAHQCASRGHEERRRAHHGSHGLHADLTSVFTFPAAVLLPLPLTAVIIISVRAARYRIARKPPYKFVHATASILLAASTVHAVLAITGVTEPLTHSPQPVVQGALATAGLAYIIQQMITVGAAIVLCARDRLPGAAVIFGDREHLAIVGLSVSLGVVLAATGAAPLAAAVMLFVAVSINGLVGHRERGRRDGGTGLPTKARWTELADGIVRAATDPGQRPAILIIDLDFFKEVNDTWGHLVGDMLLSRVATVLTDTLRSSDVAGRFGGEEFVVVLRDGDDIVAVAERIRERIEQIELVFERPAGGAPVVLTGRTASIGGARAPHDGTTLQGLLDAADAAVYRAKASGRNQVRLASERHPLAREDRSGTTVNHKSRTPSTKSTARK